MRVVTLAVLTIAAASPLALAACAPSAPPPVTTGPLGEKEQLTANPSAIIAAETALRGSLRDNADKGAGALPAAMSKHGYSDAVLITGERRKIVDLSNAEIMELIDRLSTTNPIAAYISCDGRTGISLGNFVADSTTVRPREMKDNNPSRTGTMLANFGTDYAAVWSRDMKGNYRLSQFLVGESHAPRQSASGYIETQTASCKGKANLPIKAGGVGDDLKVLTSPDQTLRWESLIPAGAASNQLFIYVWNGEAWAAGKGW